VELLTALRRRGLRTGVISNFDYRLPPLLDALGLTLLLDAVVLPADAGAAKPEAAIFQLALDRLGVAATDAVYVGDDADDDVAGATRAGLRAIDVGRIGDLRELRQLVCAE
jgi:putative hydrolase of the HAD superfamily